MSRTDWVWVGIYAVAIAAMFGFLLYLFAVGAWQ